VPFIPSACKCKYDRERGKEVRKVKQKDDEHRNGIMHGWMSCLVYDSGEERRAAGAPLLLLVVFVFDVEVFGMSAKLLVKA
jgi:hypothetical protein